MDSAPLKRHYSRYMPNPLMPTTVTDKNGRVTTVHKKLDRSPVGNRKTIPTAPPVAASAAPTVTPLTPATLLTFAQRDEFREWQIQMIENSNMGYNARAKRAMSMPHSPETEALAYRMLKSGVDQRSLIYILNDYNKDRHMFNPHGADPVEKLTSRLLLLEKITKEYPQLSPYKVHSSTLYNAWNGYGYNTKLDDREVTTIDSEEKLNEVAAVAAFLVQVKNAEDKEHYTEGEFKYPDGNKVYGIWMRNRALRKYITEKPSETHRVLDYMEERGLGAKAADTKALIKFLGETEEVGVMSDGWL